MPIDLGRRLIAAGAVSPEEVQAALFLAVVRGIPFARALVDRGSLSERGLEEELGRRGGLALRNVQGVPDLMARLPTALCRRLCAVPTRLDPYTGTVDVAAADPLDRHVAVELGFHLGAPIRILRAPMTAIEEAIRRIELEDSPDRHVSTRARRATPAFPHGAPSSTVPPAPLEEVPIPLVRRTGPMPLVDPEGEEPRTRRRVPARAPGGYVVAPARGITTQRAGTGAGEGLAPGDRQPPRENQQEPPPGAANAEARPAGRPQVLRVAREEPPSVSFPSNAPPGHTVYGDRDGARGAARGRSGRPGPASYGAYGEGAEFADRTDEAALSVGSPALAAPLLPSGLAASLRDERAPEEDPALRRAHAASRPVIAAELPRRTPAMWSATSPAVLPASMDPDAIDPRPRASAADLHAAQSGVAPASGPVSDDDVTQVLDRAPARLASPPPPTPVPRSEPRRAVTLRMELGLGLHDAAPATPPMPSAAASSARETEARRSSPTLVSRQDEVMPVEAMAVEVPHAQAVVVAAPASVPSPPSTSALHEERTYEDAPPPLPFDDAGVILQALRESRTRDEVVRLAMRGLRAVARRVAVFVVKRDGFHGWACNVEFGDVEALRKLTVPHDTPSILATATVTSIYLGPVPRTPAHGPLLAVMETAGNDVAAIAVRAGGRPAMILLVDDLGDTLGGTRRMDELARATGEALSRLLSR